MDKRKTRKILYELFGPQIFGDLCEGFMDRNDSLGRVQILSVFPTLTHVCLPRKEPENNPRTLPWLEWGWQGREMGGHHTSQAVFGKWCSDYERAKSFHIQSTGFLSSSPAQSGYLFGVLSHTGRCSGSKHLTLVEFRDDKQYQYMHQVGCQSHRLRKGPGLLYTCSYLLGWTPLPILSESLCLSGTTLFLNNTVINMFYL